MSDTPETDAATHDLSDYGPPVPCSWGDWVAADYARKLERERDEAREENKNLKLQLGLWEDGNLICEETLGEIRLLEERIEEALKELSSIHRWIERNHADGFIDSITYLQNLERVVDNWYDRIDAIEADAQRFVRERDEAREALMKIEDLFIDGTDIYADREMMGQIARDALEGAK
jgi:hypothetical protein